MKIIRELVLGIKGYLIWCHLTRPYHIKTDNFFLVYPGEEYLVPYIKKYMYSYMYEKKAIKAVFFITDRKAAASLRDHFAKNPNIDIKVISCKEAKLLMKAYWYRAVCDKFMVISLKRMYERNLDRIIDQNGITDEDIFAAGLFTLKLKKEGIRCEKRADWSFRVRT